MDHIERLSEGLATQVGGGSAGGDGGAGPFHYLVGWARQATQGRSERQVRQFLRELGSASPARVRGSVRKALPPNAIASPEQFEDVAALLVNLCQRARAAAIGGGASAAAVEAVLDGVRPHRRAGEPAGNGWDDWVLDRFLGAGPAGEVWAGRNAHRPGLRHAFKFFTDSAARQWLRRELPGLIDVRQRLGRQPNVVDLAGVAAGGPPTVGPAGDGTPDPFLVLEYVAGGSLEDWLLEASDRRPPVRSHDVMRGVVRAVAAAHERGVSHGRLTAGAVLLTDPPDVQAKVCGFGLGGLGRGELGPAGAGMYRPPEAGEGGEALDGARADVFAVGVIWYQLLVGRLERVPYDFADALRDRGQDGRTIQVISQCLARAGRRFPTAAELERALPDDLPAWSPPAGFLDVSHLVREYLGTAAAG